MAFHDKTANAARGKWRGILQEIGIPSSFLLGKNCPCPMCEGTDRFRFLDREGSGSWICNQCCERPGTGIDLVMAFLGLTFMEAASRIDAIVGNLTPDTVKARAKTSEEDRSAMNRALWTEAARCVPGDLVHRYLASRGIDEVPAELRFHPKARDGDGGIRPCMVARVLTADGSKVATLHRTFLRPDGLAKAEMDAPRKLMPGALSEGCAIRLGPVADCLGIAEGIETALSASALFDIPVWATISAQTMRTWIPPEGVSEVCIFGDEDPGYAGQAAAYHLAHRLAAKFKVNVKMPPMVGQDWNDFLLQRRPAA